MSDLWDTQTILRKNYRGTADKKVEKKNALRSGNFETKKKQTFSGNNPKKLDDHTDAGRHQTVGMKRGLLIRQARESLQDKSQKSLAKAINIDVNILSKYENGSAIPDNKILRLLEKKLSIKLTGKEDTWGKK